MASNAVNAASEVPEEQAEGPVKAVYEDIKATMRVPIVNLVFRVLATEPDFLKIAWRQLHPNAQTVYFEETAADIRRYAVEAVSRLGEKRTPVYGEEVGQVVRLFHYVNPKLLLTVAALRASVNGQLPKVAELSSYQKRQVAPGVPDGMVVPHMVDPAGADSRIQNLFADINASTGATLVNSDYRALAQWPDFLEPAWHAWKPVLGTPDFIRLQRDLRRIADDAAAMLPFRMEINPHSLRLCGLSEPQLDFVRATLDEFYRILPGLVGNTAFLAIGIDGKAIASESPFPATLA